VSLLAFISTATSVPAALDPVADEVLPGIDRFHVVDESLLRRARTEGVTPALVDRLARHIAGAEIAGADAVLVTCSSIGEAAESIAARAGVPVRRIDGPMADAAVRAAGAGAGAGAGSRRIGVLATLTSTLEPTTRLIRRAAGLPPEGDRPGGLATVTVTPVVCDGAFDRLAAGDREGHDDAVRTALARLAAGCDVVVLAQASTARVLDGAADVRATDGRSVPVFTSPRSGVAQMGPVLAAG
jgi:hypothetical protein